MPPVGSSPPPGTPRTANATSQPSVSGCPFHRAAAQAAPAPATAASAAPTCPARKPDAYEAAPQPSTLAEARKAFIARDYREAAKVALQAASELPAGSREQKIAVTLSVLAEQNAKCRLGDTKEPIHQFDDIKRGLPASERIAYPDVTDRLPPKPTALEVAARLPAKIVNEITGKLLGPLIDGLSELSARHPQGEILFAKQGGLITGMRSQLEANGERNRMNTRGMQRPENGRLVNGGAPGQPRDEWTEYYQTPDGSEQTDDPLEGAAGTAFFAQGTKPVEQLKDDPNIMDPDPATVARELLYPKEGQARKQAPFISNAVPAWLQWFVHDQSVHGVDAGVITLPVGDGDPIKTLLDQSEFWIREEEPVEPGLHIYRNRATHSWDGSQIYGMSQDQQDAIRRGGFDRTTEFPANGHIFLREGKYLPYDEKTGVPLTGLADNWSIHTAAFHEFFARNHNRICDELRAKETGRNWTSDALFLQAKLINTAMMAIVHTVDWTVAILNGADIAKGMNTNQFGMIQANLKKREDRKVGASFKPTHHVLGGYPGNKRDNHGVPMSLSEHFPVVYRLHTLVEDEYEWRPIALVKDFGPLQAGETIEPVERVPFNAVREAGALSDVKGYGKPSDAESAYSMADVFSSLMYQHSHTLEPNNYPLFMRNLAVGGRAAIDLGAVDVYRGRRHGRYNEYREGLLLPPLTSFEQFGGDPEYIERMKRVYGGDISKVDIIPGLLSEAKRADGFVLEPSRFKLFVRDASRRWEMSPWLSEKFDERHYTKTGMSLIEGVTFKGLLEANYPELKETGLRWLNNGFEPAATSYLTAPDEHPLSKPGHERYRIRAEQDAPRASEEKKS